MLIQNNCRALLRAGAVAAAVVHAGLAGQGAERRLGGGQMIEIAVVVVVVVVITIMIILVLRIIIIIIIMIVVVVIIVIIVINIYWLRTNGVNANWAAAEVRDFDGLGKKVPPVIFGKTKVG